ncbi:MAG: lysylphosphatidylglycerol synthase transmembrane domain-containing protein [Candidatus Hodarchaeales archaeon]|jgi:uncharacterized protein (TIRG00374 family)
MEKQENKALNQLLSFKSFMFGLVLAVTVYLVMMILSGWEDLINNIFSIDPIILIIAMLLSLANYLFRFLKWHLFTKSLKLDVPFRENFLIFFAGLSLSITPAKAGEAIRAFLLKEKTKTGLSEGLASTFSERLIDLLAVTLLALMGIVVLGTQYSLDYWPVLVVILIGIIFGVLIFLLDPLYKIIQWLFWLKPWGSIGLKIDKFRDDVIITLQYNVFLSALLLGMIGWSCEGIGFFLIAQNLGIQITFEAAIFIYTTSSLLGAVSFLPGGLGVMEGSMELFLAQFLIISTALAGALIILTRIVTLWFGIALGLIFLLIVSNRINKSHKNGHGIGQS